MGVNCRSCVVRPQSKASHSRGSLRVQAYPPSLSYPEFSHYRRGEFGEGVAAASAHTGAA